MIIALMLVLSVALNFTLAYRSQQAADRLREQVGQTAIVLRDGAACERPVREVVPGDVVQLKAGDLVPADARLLAAKDSSSAKRRSRVNRCRARSTRSRRAGRSGSRQRGQRRVSRNLGGERLRHCPRRGTGPSTEFGRVAAALVGRPPETEFERGTRRFGFLILQVVIFLVLFAFLVNALLRRDLLESFLFSVALAVGLTPELLPMIVSVTLASGAVRMARRKVIVKQLAAIENFGSMDILLQRQDGHAHGRADLGGPARQPARGERRDRDPARRSQQRLPDRAQEPDGRGHPPPRASGRRQYTRVDEIPFDFQRRCLSVVVEEGGRRLLDHQGRAGERAAPLRVGRARRRGGAARRADASAAIDDLFHRLSAEGYRALAVAYRAVEAQAGYAVADERELVFVGFAAFLDPAARGRGGDARRAAGRRRRGQDRHGRQRARHAADLRPGRARRRRRRSSAATSSACPTPRSAAVAERTAVFARVSPIQKNRIVRALHARGHVVGVIGRRHQRRARAPLGRRRHLGRERRGRRQGRRRHHPAREAAGACSTTASWRAGGASATS